MGGMLAAIEPGYVQREIHEAAYRAPAAVEAGARRRRGRQPVRRGRAAPRERRSRPTPRVERERARAPRRAGAPSATRRPASARSARSRRAARGTRQPGAAHPRRVEARATLGEMCDRCAACSACTGRPRCSEARRTDSTETFRERPGPISQFTRTPFRTASCPPRAPARRPRAGPAGGRMPSPERFRSGIVGGSVPAAWPGSNLRDGPGHRMEDVERRGERSPETSRHTEWIRRFRPLRAGLGDRLRAAQLHEPGAAERGRLLRLLARDAVRLAARRQLQHPLREGRPGGARGPREHPRPGRRPTSSCCRRWTAPAPRGSPAPST